MPRVRVLLHDLSSDELITNLQNAVECDSASSVIAEVETGRGIALATPVFKFVTGKRLLYRPLTGTTEVASVGIARATKAT